MDGIVSFTVLIFFGCEVSFGKFKEGAGSVNVFKINTDRFFMQANQDSPRAVTDVKVQVS